MSVRERRRFARYPLSGDRCELDCGSGAAVGCELSDVSLRGVRLVLGGGPGPEVGQRVRLSGCSAGELGGLLSTRMARVAWRSGADVGLELSRPLAELPLGVTGSVEEQPGLVWTSY